MYFGEAIREGRKRRRKVCSCEPGRMSVRKLYNKSEAQRRDEGVNAGRSGVYSRDTARARGGRNTVIAGLVAVVTSDVAVL